MNGSISNISRFIADSFLSVEALRREAKSAVPTDAEVERRYREFRRLWQRIVVGSRVNERSNISATLSGLYAPILTLIGFPHALERLEIHLDPESVRLWTFDGESASVLVDVLPFALSADDRLPSGEFRGTAQRRMERALSAAGMRFGLILGGTRWRVVQLDTANEPRYLEFDLDAFSDDRLGDFAVFSALVSPAFLCGETPILGELLQRSDELGTEVSEKLGPAARRALERLLEGVRADDANAAWAKEVFAEGETLQAIHREGIYALYRLLFVLFGESAVPSALPIDKPLYRNSYSLERLRLALSGDVTGYAENEYGLWESVKALFRLIDRGATTKEFHIPAYNGGLFAPDRTPQLDCAQLSDRAFAQTLRELTTVTIGKGKKSTRDRVSFRQLGVAQLGAVFEGLLDYEPHIAAEDLYEVGIGSGKQKAISFLPASAVEDLAGDEQPARLKGQFYLQAWGGQRKSTGAYYTPDVIADYLVREALGPQIEGKSADEILRISVCDPAMGSGGFLVSATEFLGEAYYQAQVREGVCDPQSEFADRDRIAAKRIVAERCIYGVDMNPMAVELAKVSLWLTTLSYDRPLSFFDHHLRCGNSLLGAPLRRDDGEITSERIESIPSAALQCVDKEASKSEREALKAVAKRNDAELRAMERGGMFMFAIDLREPLEQYAQARAELSIDDPSQSVQDAVERIRAKERQLRELTQDHASPFHRLKEVCDLWMAPWFWPHDAQCEPPTTDEYQTLMRRIWEGQSPQSPREEALLEQSERIAERHRFFHWELEFPEVFERGGFNAIVGNPPWETLSPKTQEFFANYDPRFREYGKQRAIARMQFMRESREIDAAFRSYSRDRYQQSTFLRESEVYPLCSQDGGNVDIFRVFIERDMRAIRSSGSLGVVLPSSVYTNTNCAELRKALTAQYRLRQIIVNQNERFAFPIHHAIKVALLIVDRESGAETFDALFCTGKDTENNMRALSLRQLEAVLAAPQRHLFEIPLDLLRRLSPATLAFVEVSDAADIALLEHLNRCGIPFASAWEVRYCRELDMTNDSSLFFESGALERIGAIYDGMRWHHPTEGEFWPLVEGKHIYQYEFPVGDFRYWVSSNHSSRLPLHDGRPINGYPRLAWRDVASSTNERTLIAAMVEEKTFCNNKAKTFIGLPERVGIETCKLLNSFCLDWQIRLRGLTTITYTAINDAVAPTSLASLRISADDRSNVEAAVMLAFSLPFELAEHVMKGFPLLDRLQQPLPDEPRSTITRDLVLAAYAEMLQHPKAGFYRERAEHATAMGARPFIPATRAESAAEEDVLVGA